MSKHKGTSSRSIFFVPVLLIVSIVVAAVYWISESDQDDFFNIGDSQVTSPTFKHQSVVVVDEYHQQFLHPRYGFSVVIPKDLDIIRVDEGQMTETVVFIPKIENSEPVMQIFVTPYLPHEITKERLAKDVPGGEIKDLSEVLIGPGNDIRAVRFASTHLGLGEAREVWFLRNGYLFEVTTRMDNDAWLASVLKTWQFAD